jgi:NitT/TauT family transport system permease protein
LPNVVQGLKSVDADFRDLFRSPGASQARECARPRPTFALPFLFSALKISSSLAVVGANAGELAGAANEPGYFIMICAAHLERATLFSAVFASPLAGIALFHAIGLVMFRRPADAE